MPQPEARLTITLRRSPAEHLVGGLCGLAVAIMLTAGVYFASKSQTEFSCERATDECSVVSNDIFGSHIERFPLHTLTASRILTQHKRNGYFADWVLEVGSGHVTLATADDLDLRRRYAVDSAALQSFIGDVKQQSFSRRFQADDASVAGFSLAALLFAVPLALYLNGWRARLIFDREHQQLTAALWPLRRGRFPLARVHAARVSSGAGRDPGLLSPVYFELIGDDGVLFSRRKFGGRRAMAEMAAVARRVQEFLAAAAAAA